MVYGMYPFFGSGNIVISDLDDGFFCGERIFGRQYWSGSRVSKLYRFAGCKWPGLLSPEVMSMEDQVIIVDFYSLGKSQHI